MKLMKIVQQNINKIYENNLKVVGNLDPEYFYYILRKYIVGWRDLQFEEV